MSLWTTDNCIIISSIVVEEAVGSGCYAPLDRGFFEGGGRQHTRNTELALFGLRAIFDDGRVSRGLCLFAKGNETVVPLG
jgi:hypothetical protein